MSDAPSPLKKRAKGAFRIALCLALLAALLGLIAAQWMAPSGKTMPMWLFGALCLGLACLIVDSGLGARRDFDEARFARSLALARASGPSSTAPLESLEAPGTASIGAPAPASDEQRLPR